MRSRSLRLLACLPLLAAIGVLVTTGCQPPASREQQPTTVGAPPVIEPSAGEREQMIAERLQNVRQLQRELKYREALDEIDEMLVIDEGNAAALALRDVMQHNLKWLEYVESQRESEQPYQWHAIENQPALVAPTDDVTRGVPTFDGAPELDLSAALDPGFGAAAGVGSGTRRASSRTVSGGLHGDLPLVGGIFRSGDGGVRPATHLITTLTPGEELWIIARAAPAERAAAPPDDDTPGCGTLLCRPPGAPDTEREVPLPLKHTDVDGDIAGYVASVTVTQQFHNPFNGKIEASYVFPLPQDAAVSEFVMTVGERRIRGIIRERAEAERIYTQARAQGHVASLLSQQRPNIFTQKVANIEPGHAIDIEITYFNTLAYVDGWYQFVFPMVVGPRFNPPGASDPILAVPRGTPTGNDTAVPYLRPGERSGHDIALALTIDAGVPIDAIECPSHVIETSGRESARTEVRLGRNDSIPNRDFVLRYRLDGDAPRASLLTHRDERGGFFTLMVHPPRGLADRARAPIEMVFVMDTSGSMKGEPIAQARRALVRALKQLRPEDAFQVIRFSNDSSALGPAPLPASDENVALGVRFVESLEAGGGTMMLAGLRAALDFPHDPERLRFVTFMTDGYIGNETEIMGALHDRLGAARVFSFGMGSSPNRYLLERMAKIGRGAVAYVGLQDDASEVMDLFVQRISHPGMTDLGVDFGGLEVRDVYPRRLPDLFTGRPVILTGRYAGSGTATVRVTGRVGSETVEIPVTASLDETDDSRRALPNVWARRRIADLADRATWDDDPTIADTIRSTALEFGLVSAYTSFVAVDASRVTDGSFGTIVPVGVPVPDGVRYDTTVGRN